METTPQDRKEMRERAKAFGERMMHTPGPWAANGDEVTDGVAADPGVIARCLWGDRKVAEANARLIAAAPELLDAARRLLEYEGYHDRPRTTIPAWDAVINAIRKAEGRAS